ncbi:hypothetical protein [Pseudonocardia spinosispora]|uniref:hypothetical protein n=1 Tax=Pseudonocardia spinosispora TaxID=103441 RepID=UPI00041EECD3|nr:hypothetical protein [Pseudonocardia spinosispora]
MARTAWIGVVLGLVMTLVGCAGAPPPPAPAPPVGYQDRLSRTDRDISAAFDGIARAPDLPALTQSVLGAAGVVSAASEQLATGGPTPIQMTGPNGELVAALRQFGYELAYLSQQINLQVICTGSTAAAAITTAPSMDALRAASTGIGTPTADRPAFEWGGWIPAARDAVNARMPNGRVVVDRRAAGSPADGVLEVTDDEDVDAVLALSRQGKIVVSVAVGARKTVRLDGIPDGVYDLYYSTGTDWDDVVGAFGRGCEFHRFTDPTTFSSQALPDGTSYTVQTITLHTSRDEPGAAPEDAAGAAADEAPEVPPTQLPR